MAWESTKARKEARIKDKARKRAHNKKAQLKVRVMGLAVTGRTFAPHPPTPPRCCH